VLSQVQSLLTPRGLKLTSDEQSSLTLAPAVSEFA